LLRSVNMLSDGGGVAPFVTDCPCCFEQVFQAACAPPAPLAPLDFVCRSVWTISKGQHTCAIRPAAEAAAASSPMAQRWEMSSDIWVSTNAIEPNSAVVRIVVQPPPALSAAMRSVGGNGSAAAKKMVAWTRRLQEAAVMLYRSQGK